MAVDEQTTSQTDDWSTNKHIRSKPTFLSFLSFFAVSFPLPHILFYYLSLFPFADLLRLANIIFYVNLEGPTFFTL